MSRHVPNSKVGNFLQIANGEKKIVNLYLHFSYAIMISLQFKDFFKKGQTSSFVYFKISWIHRWSISLLFLLCLLITFFFFWWFKKVRLDNVDFDRFSKIRNSIWVLRLRSLRRGNISTWIISVSIQSKVTLPFNEESISTSCDITSVTIMYRLVLWNNANHHWCHINPDWFWLCGIIKLDSALFYVSELKHGWIAS